ncbi:dihydroorotate dehydrogenase electron transfer subunit [Streptococcus acidominimus]|uniref:Dihydroorotate dehydrogenase B (NAD(+)), electron transfer subunit n=1 Tax=Streptococcus acidominimus TaxID=1326 RepID=A0A4Y9FQW0_STRAI|nr:dihydroorotate dehydrogenase electron transfer subunit [Streptococcus acidominimus]MBF0818470.1 dihydroorotate dehydrogenase electron transfer subunit [Streptococcus acidominimus]MBF0838002.1 dihydroorotate dehydrogenase electron transfer subunit [Streptococcus acidominimus]MBF0848478.1 dihydroorotate dehydrogenase electron transfer subunit [Streptococcus danieliae]TFU31252.1 dihydroorotate dehydrogenase electron transfer subunit [Streptococcus acidominimus]
MILKEMMTIVRQDCLAPNIFSLHLRGEMVSEMKPGQFLHLKVPDKSMLLRRPISISEIDLEQREARLIYRIEGQGTALFSQMQEGEKIDVMGPLGNGFPLDHLEAGQTILIIGGGIGVPPLLELAKQAYHRGVKVVSVIGFADRQAVILEEELRRYGEVFVTTDNGSYGQQGYVTTVVDRLSDSFAAVYACGAPAMMAYVDKRFQDHPHAYLSLEARMACGMGACYACVVRPKGGQEHENQRVCKEGPVFATGSLVL